MTELTIQGLTGLAEVPSLRSTKTDSASNSGVVAIDPKASFQNALMGLVQWNGTNKNAATDAGAAATGQNQNNQGKTVELENPSISPESVPGGSQLVTSGAGDKTQADAYQAVSQAASGAGALVVSISSTSRAMQANSQKFQTQVAVAKVNQDGSEANATPHSPQATQPVVDSSTGQFVEAASYKEASLQVASEPATSAVVLVGQSDLAKAEVHDGSSATSAPAVSSGDAVKPAVKSESKPAAGTGKPAAANLPGDSLTQSWSSTVATVAGPIVLPASGSRASSVEGGRTGQAILTAKPAGPSVSTTRTTPAKTSSASEPISIVAGTDQSGHAADDAKATTSGAPEPVTPVAIVHASGTDSTSSLQGSTTFSLLPAPSLSTGAGGFASVPAVTAQSSPTVADRAAEAQGPWESQPQTLASTPNVLEVGVSSGSHGWLRVRAEVNDTGAISASVTSTSAASADSLHKQMPEMSAYLAQEHIGLSSLVMDHTRGLSTSVGTATESNGSGQDAAFMASQQQAEQRQDESAPSSGLISSSSSDGVSRGNADGTASASTQSATPSLTNGRWLNVLA